MDFPAQALDFIHNLDIAILSEDGNGLLNFYNEAAQAVFGHNPQEILGTPSINLAPKELWEKRGELFQKVLRIVKE